MMLNALARTPERRHQPREAANVPCTVNWSGLYEFATIKNMSIYGAQLEGFVFPRAGTPVTIVVNQVELCASIIWADGEKCGVLLEELVPEGAGQGDLFAVADPRAPALLAAMDGLNDRYGRGTVQLAAQGFGARGFDTKRSHKSPSWTTRIAEIPIAR